MNALAKEVADLVESIPPEKAQSVVEFARFVAEREDAEAWRREFADPKYAPKLRALAQEALQEHDAGMSKDLDPDKM